MNNYPGYSQQRFGNLFPAYGRSQLRPSHNPNFRPQGPRPHNEFPYNGHGPPFSPHFPGSRPPLIRQGNLNEGLNFRQITNTNDYPSNDIFYHMQRTPQQYARPPPPVSETKDFQGSSGENMNQLSSDSLNHKERLLSNNMQFDNYSKRQRMDLGLRTNVEALQDVSSPLCHQTSFSTKDSLSLKDSSSGFSNAVISVKDSLYSEIPSPKHESIKEDNLIKEIQQLKQQQKLRELIDSHLAAMKNLQHSPISENKILQHSPAIDKNMLLGSGVTSKPTPASPSEIFPSEDSNIFKNIPDSGKTKNFPCWQSNITNDINQPFESSLLKRDYNKSAPTSNLISETELVSPIFNNKKTDSNDQSYNSIVSERCNEHSNYSNSPIITPFFSECTSNTSSERKNDASSRIDNEPAFLSQMPNTWNKLAPGLDNNINSSELSVTKEPDMFSATWNSRPGMEKDKLSQQNNFSSNDTVKTSNSNPSTHCTSEVQMELKTDIPMLLSSLQKALESPSKTNYVSEDSASVNEWTRSSAIPFLGDSIDDNMNSNAMSTTNLQSQQSTASATSAVSLKSGKKKRRSTLEDALIALDIQEPVTGLGYIIEYKNNLSVDGGFAFRCNLCNSSITRSLIINHILGSKHRLRFMKLKDEDTHEYLIKLNVLEKDRDVKIAEAAQRMEKIFGRGKVIIELDSSIKDAKRASPIVMNLRKIEDHALNLMSSDFEAHHKVDIQISQNKEVISAKPIEKESTNQYSGASPPKTDTTKEVHLLDNDKSTNNQISSSNNTKLAAIDDSVKKAESFHSNEAVVSECLPFSPAKRPASPYDQSSQHKVMKKADEKNNTDLKSIHNDASVQVDDTGFVSDALIQQESTEANQQVPLVQLLEQLSKADISSEEEATAVMEVTDVLLKLLLRYKLQNVVCDDKEKLTSSLLSTSPGKLQELLVSAELKSPSEDKNSETTEVMGSNSLSQNTTQPIALTEKQVPALSVEQNLTLSCASRITVANTMSSNQAVSNPAVSACHSSGTAQDKVVNSNNGTLQSLSLAPTATTVSVAPPSSTALLPPPPFFNFTKSSEPISSLQAQEPMSTMAQSNLVWSSPYHSQMNFFQQPGYAGTATMYQPYGMAMAQFMPMQMSLPSFPQSGQFTTPPLPPTPQILQPPLPISSGCSILPPLPDAPPPPLPAAAQPPPPPPPPPTGGS